MRHIKNTEPYAQLLRQIPPNKLAEGTYCTIIYLVALFMS